MHATFESDVTSISPYFSPSSPKRAMYYVQSPPRDSHDEADKSSRDSHSGGTIPTYQSSTDESPSHLSRHSMASAASRISLRDNRGRSGNIKEWQQCQLVEEDEGGFDDYYGNREYRRHCKILMVVISFTVVFSTICLIIWGVNRPYHTHVSVKTLIVHDVFYGEGSDWTGVPTRFLTLNCTANIMIYNPAKFFGIHVSSHPVNLIYMDITVANGQLKKYYQPKKSVRTMSVRLEGQRIPLYGAGMSLAASDKNGGFPLKLEFEIKSKGYLFGKLLKTTRRMRVSCSLLLNSESTRLVIFKHNSCKYD